MFELDKSKYNESWSIMYLLDRIGGVIFSVLPSSVVDRRFDKCFVPLLQCILYSESLSVLLV